MYKKLICSIVIGATLLMCGCASDPVEFSNFDQINGRQFKQYPKEKASARSFVFLGIIPIGAGSRESKIKDQLVKRTGADALINIEISSRYSYIVIGCINTLTVTAVPIKFTDKNYK